MPNPAALRQALSAMLDHVGQASQGNPAAMQGGPLSGQQQTPMPNAGPPSMMGPPGMDMRAALQNAAGQQQATPQPPDQLDELKHILQQLMQARAQLPDGAPQAQQLDAQIAQVRQVLGQASGQI